MIVRDYKHTGGEHETLNSTPVSIINKKRGGKSYFFKADCLPTVNTLYIRLPRTNITYLP